MRAGGGGGAHAVHDGAHAVALVVVRARADDQGALAVARSGRSGACRRGPRRRRRGSRGSRWPGWWRWSRRCRSAASPQPQPSIRAMSWRSTPVSLGDVVGGRAGDLEGSVFRGSVYSLVQATVPRAPCGSGRVRVPRRRPAAGGQARMCENGGMCYAPDFSAPTNRSPRRRPRRIRSRARRPPLGAEVTLVERAGVGGSAVLTDVVPSKTLIATADLMTPSARPTTWACSSTSRRRRSSAMRADLKHVNKRLLGLARQQSDDIPPAWSSRASRSCTAPAAAGQPPIEVLDRATAPRPIEADTIVAGRRAPTRASCPRPGPTANASSPGPSSTTSTNCPRN